MVLYLGRVYGDSEAGFKLGLSTKVDWTSLVRRRDETARKRS